jgi:hypothetical protein
VSYGRCARSLGSIAGRHYPNRAGKTFSLLASPALLLLARHRDYSPPVRRHRATERQKRIGWEMAVRIEKIVASVLNEAHDQQTEEVVDTLSKGPEGFYRSYLD